MSLHNEINFLVEQAKILGIDKFLYKYSKTHGASAAFAALQLELKDISILKVPEHASKGALFTRKSLEQGSSESTAIYKASHFNGKNILILAAGLGIDDWAFSKRFKEVISVDSDTELNALSKYNYWRLNIKNIVRLDNTAENFLKTNKMYFDIIYIDPDRRIGSSRQILLKTHQPNVIKLLPELLKFSSKILIKCSPMYDYEMAIKELPGISEIYSISKNGEMKEMLLYIDEVSKKSGIKVHCCDIKEKENISASFIESKTVFPNVAEQLKGYLYEMGSSLIKMRKHHAYAKEKNLFMLDKSIPYYCSEFLQENLIARRFKIIISMPFQSKKCKAYFNQNSIYKANIKTRGLRFNTKELIKKLELKDGGDDYIFVLPFQSKAMLIHCKSMN